MAPLNLLHGNLNAILYQNQVLHDVQVLGDRCVATGLPWIFMQDLAPAHNANSTRQFLKQKGVRILLWPGYSPDMNPIEYVCAEVVRRMPQTLQRDLNVLLERVQAAWLSEPLSYNLTL